MALIPQLIISKICHRTFNATVCGDLGQKTFKSQENVVYNEATLWNTLVNIAIFIPAMFTVLPSGAISSQICKRLILFFPSFTLLCQCIIYIFCASIENSHVGLLAIGAFMSSLSAERQGAIGLSMIYLASVTKDDYGRTLLLIYLELALFLGQGIGSLISGLILHSCGFTAAFVFSTSLALLCIVYVAFFLAPVPTSKSNEKEKDAGTAAESCWITIISCLATVRKDLRAFIRVYIIGRNWNVILLLLMSFLTVASNFGESVMLPIFLKHSPLNLNASQIALFLLLLYSVRVFGIVLLGVISLKRVKPSDTLLVIISLLSVFATELLIGISSTKTMLFSFAGFSITFGYALPSTKALLTKLVSRESQPIAVSFTALMNSISATIITFTLNNIFKATAPFFPGFCFIVLSSAALLSLVLMTCLCVCGNIALSTSKKDNKDIVKPNEIDPLLINSSE